MEEDKVRVINMEKFMEQGGINFIQYPL